MRLPAPLRQASERERIVLGAAMTLSFGLVIAYVLATRSQGLGGEEVEYHTQGTLFTEGKPWWSEAPLGEPHASAWRAPGYPAWVGFWYSVIGTSALRLTLVQALLAPVTVLLTWVLARRLFDTRVALMSACVVGVFPLVWEYFGLLFPEALAIPLTLAVLIASIDREPTPARVALIGALIGASLLVRPTAFFLLAGVAAAWIVAAGWRRGLVLTAAATMIAVIVVAPWTIRNYIVLDGFVPISIQDAAAYGTFNDEAASDEEYPYAWRATPAALAEVIELDEPISEPELRSRLQTLAHDYIKEHPASLPKAFFWNGITRLWDLRAPSKALAEVESEGRSRAVRAVGLGLYYAILPLAAMALWRLRRRPEIVWPVIAIAVVSMLAFAIIAGTRYRAPLEPLLVILAAVAVCTPSTRGARSQTTRMEELPSSSQGPG